MNISRQQNDELYNAIVEEVVKLRVELKLSPNDDIKVSQLIFKIWDRQKLILRNDPLLRLDK